MKILFTRICKRLTLVSFTVILSVALLPSKCYAALYELKDEIDAYNQGDFQSVVFIGRINENKCIGEDNEIARYYLASAYVHLNRTQEAILEYRVCWLDGKNPTIKDYAEQALRTLQPESMPKSNKSSSRLGISDGTDIKFVPIGSRKSNNFVRNYENFDGDLAPPPKVTGLRAKEKILKLNVKLTH